MELHQARERFSGIKLPCESGPIASHVDVLLSRHKICRQAYHSKSFTGNHCNKYLQTGVFESVCEGILEKTRELTHDENIVDEAIAITEKFSEINSLFSKVHASISHSNPMQENQIADASRNISQYMLRFRELFPNCRIILKQHILECHAIDWLSIWKFGFGFHGEQGAESIHRVFNKLTATHSGVRNELNQLHSVMKQHLTDVSPEIQNEISQLFE